MRRFYEQVRADDTTFYFYTECAICRRRQYSKRLPLLCRSKKVLNSDKGLRQKIYKRFHAAAVQDLAIQLNRCEYCGRWVCDHCYHSGDKEACCLDCANKNEIRRMNHELSEACDS
ncbi:MAG: hypothetical protein E7475_06975 [Ruminococcaceae bacterium]|nr:hypothetical protein [Oscillospiraceae bacterium]MBQ9969571.1 hypothetical protein [Oscillospiraceae bacterium]